MSNHLAIAAASWALRTAVQTAAESAVPEAVVTSAVPGGAAGGEAPARVNVFLFQVATNTAARNADLPTRTNNGGLLRRPGLALDLRYLLTFYGSEKTQQPQRLLGAVMTALHARPDLDRDAIAHALELAANDPSGALTHLQDSDLAAAPDLVRLTPAAMSLDELSKLWGMFGSHPYALSTAYAASLVVLEPTSHPQPGLPVGVRTIAALAARPPILTNIAPAVTAVIDDARLTLRGRNLAAADVLVRIDDRDTVPLRVSDSELVVALPDGLDSGPASVRVLHREAIGDPPRPRVVASSNARAISVLPVLGLPTAALQAGAVQITVPVAPAPREGQETEILLSGPASVTLPAVRLADDPRVLVARATLAAGRYLVRARVDGAESALRPTAADPDGPYAEPFVDVPG